MFEDAFQEIHSTLFLQNLHGLQNCEPSAELSNLRVARDIFCSFFGEFDELVMGPSACPMPQPSDRANLIDHFLHSPLAQDDEMSFAPLLHTPTDSPLLYPPLVDSPHAHTPLIHTPLDTASVYSLRAQTPIIFPSSARSRLGDTDSVFSRVHSPTKQVQYKVLEKRANSIRVRYNITLGSFLLNYTTHQSTIKTQKGIGGCIVWWYRPRCIYEFFSDTSRGAELMTKRLAGTMRATASCIIAWADIENHLLRPLYHNDVRMVMERGDPLVVAHTAQNFINSFETAPRAIPYILAPTFTQGLGFQDYFTGGTHFIRENILGHRTARG
jgi:hypothetical protein